MKNKTLTIVLSIILMICIGANIYQYMTTSRLQESLYLLTNTKKELTSNIENKTTELNNITSEIEEANTTISELTAKVESLSSSINSTQLEIDTLQQKLDDEYKGDEETISDEEIDDIAEQIYQEILAEHPELQSNADNTNKSPDYISVDGPVDTGEFENPDFNLDGDYSGLEGGQVY